MNCAEFEIRLADYLDETLGTTDMRLLEDHAAVCAGCGELLADSTVGLKLLRTAEEVAPPPDLLTRISYQAPAGRLRHPLEKQGFFSKLLQPILQPRLAMGMAMTILSFAMLERCTGIHVQHIQAADLSPVRIWGGLEDKTLRLKDRAVKYYENLRWVYEIETRLTALQGQSVDGAGQAKGTPANQPASKEKDEKR